MFKTLRRYFFGLVVELFKFNSGGRSLFERGGGAISARATASETLTRRGYLPLLSVLVICAPKKIIEWGG